MVHLLVSGLGEAANFVSTFGWYPISWNVWETAFGKRFFFVLMAVSMKILQCHATHTLGGKHEVICVFLNFFSISIIFLILNNSAEREKLIFVI
jgi:hypothetical protein